MKTISPKLDSPRKARSFARNSPRRIAGVDISANRIRMVLLEDSSKDEPPRLIKTLEQPLEPFQDLDSGTLAQKLRDGLTNLAGNSRNLAVWTGAGIDRIRIHHLRLPSMKPRHLAQAVYWAVQREGAFSQTKMVLEFEIEKELTNNGKTELAITAFLIPREDCERIAGIFEAAGFPLAGYILPFYTMRNFFETGWIHDPAPVHIISHIDQEISRIGIWEENRCLLSRAIPIGMEQLVDEVLTTFKQTSGREEILGEILRLGKPSGDFTQNPDRIFQAIQPSLDRMIRQIERTLSFYQSQNETIPRPVSLYLTGMITESPHCLAYLRDQSPVPLQVIDPFAGTTTPEKTSPTDEHERLPYATAVGLALASRKNIPNFLHTYKERQLIVRHQRVSQGIFLLFFIVAALLTAFYAKQRVSLNQLQADRAKAESQLQQHRPGLTAADLIHRTTALRRDFTEISTEIDRRELLAILSHLGKTKPPEMQFHSISGVLNPSADPKRPNPRSLQISGTLRGEPSMLVTELGLYLRNLKKSPYFSDISSRFEEPDESAADSQLDFQLNLTLVHKTAPAK